jgi:ribonucleotide reductase alpha subunit
MSVSNYNEVYKSCLDYFNGDELAASATVTKYLMQDKEGNYLEKNPDDYLKNRIAKEFARIESKYPNSLTQDEIYQALKGYEKIYCAGSPTYAIGNNQKIASAANCFFVGSPSDSIGSIIRKDEELAQICKRRGGVGIDISTIRPHGMSVNNAACTTDGVMVFLERYSNTIKGIAQNGRRGAGIAIMDCRHPEIERFITIKQDLSKITGMNISVKWTDSFFKALENNSKFTLQFPVDVPIEKATYTKEVDAKELWTLFCKSAHNTAEPGCLYWGNIINNSISDCYASDGFATEGTNPCLTGDTLVYCADGRGHVPIQVLAEEGKDVDVFCYDDNGKIVIRKMRNPRITGYNEKIYRVTFDDGNFIECTDKHKLRTLNASYVPVIELKEGDHIQAIVKVEALFNNNNTSNYCIQHSNVTAPAFENQIIKEHDYVIDDNRYIADIIDGVVYVQKTCEICDNTFMIEYNRRESSYCSLACVNESKTHIFNNPHKGYQDELIWSRVTNVECVRTDTVYNGTVDDFHNFFIGGFESMQDNGKRKWLYINNLQCGEILLSKYSSCILMGLNLYGFVDNPYTSNSSFNFNTFSKYVSIASRLIDDLVDIEIEKTEQIIKKIEQDTESEDDKAIEYKLWQSIKYFLVKGRRTGLGVTGMADMLAAVGIKYDSTEAVEMCDKVFATFHIANMETQAILSKERGTFECWDYEKEKNNPFITILPDNVQADIKMNGRRNISTTTIAPVGTISLLTQTSSGIEPVFQLEYTRRKKLSQAEENNGVAIVNTDSDGIKWTEFKVYHHGVKRWMEATGETDITKSPYWGCTSSNIDWKFRVQLQGMINSKYITHSISSTINLPKDATVDRISEIYLEGWKTGCRGLTVYREGSRDGVLINNNTDKTADRIAPKRPEVLPCHIHQSVIKEHKWIFFVGIHNGVPYEILGGKESVINVPKKYIKSHQTENAWIIKEKEHGKTIYSVVLGTLHDSDEKQKFKDIASIFDPDNGSPTRLISALLRHGMRIFDICEQLHKMPQEDSMFTFEAGIRRVLKKYISDNTKTKSKCQECASIMIFENGCVKCANCGWTKCD